MRPQTSSSRFVRREILLFVIAVAVSVAFLNHENLYLENGFRLITRRIEPYLLVTAVAYLFLRFAVIAVELRPPRVHAELVRCPECGQWMDDTSAAGPAAHQKADAAAKTTRQPTPKDAVPVAALRRAIDAARSVTPMSEDPETTPDAAGATSQNVDSRDLVKALGDPSFLEPMRRAPKPPEVRPMKPR
jgi:hypothetical protein